MPKPPAPGMNPQCVSRQDQLPGQWEPPFPVSLAQEAARKGTKA